MNHRPGNNRITISFEEMIRQYREFRSSGRDPVRKLRRPEKIHITQPANGKPCPVCSIRMRYIDSGITYGTHDQPDSATVEHKLPRSTGGTNDDENLLPMCNACNHARGDVLSEILKLSRREDEAKEVEEVLHWLWLQLTNPLQAAVTYPQHQSHFQKQWEYYHRHEKTFPSFTPIISIRPGRTNMSASARLKRQLQRQLQRQMEMESDKKQEGVR